MDVDKKTRLEPFSFPDGQKLTTLHDSRPSSRNATLAGSEEGRLFSQATRILTEINTSNPH